VTVNKGSRIRLLNNQYSVINPAFGHPECPIELDMGCGSGRFALNLARRKGEHLILASDVMIGRLRKLERKLDNEEISNIELLRANNEELVGYQLPDSSIYRLHILCPDPWPKKRHRGRRLLSSDFLTRVARVLEPGGVLHVSTDDKDYLALIRSNAEAFSFIKEDKQQEAISDIRGLTTEFEEQWRHEGKSVPHLVYRVYKPSKRPC